MMAESERIQWFSNECFPLFDNDFLLSILIKTDYFTAPASSTKRYHHCYEGGLFEHSKDVYEELWTRKIYPLKSSCFLVGMFHDACKIGLYLPNYNKDGKTLNGRKPYNVDPKVAAYGHGVGSLVWCLDNSIPLTHVERLGILWHMTGDVYRWSYVRDHVHTEFEDIDYVKAADEKSTSADKKRRAAE